MQYNIELHNDLIAAFDEIQMPRSEYELRKFVIESQDTPAKAYAHCVLELSNKYDNLRLANIDVQIKEHEIADLEAKSDKISMLEAQKKRIELEQTNRARLGALREFEALYRIWNEFEHKYTRAEIDADQPEYWSRRISRQANNDMVATGRVSPSNVDALHMIGKASVPALDVVRDVERRYLENGNVKILLAVATQEQAVNGLPCLDGLDLPNNFQFKILNVHGRTIDDAYDYAVQEAIKDDADFLFTVEDDTFPQKDAIVRLMQYAINDPLGVYGAWYPKRTKTRQGTAIVLKNGKREFLDDDGQMHEVYTIPMGCTVYPMSLFYKVPRPWFVTTNVMTQDSFLSQLAREAGYTLYVDTAIKCKHIDRETKEIFE
jgi:hypothetical protein